MSRSDGPAVNPARPRRDVVVRHPGLRVVTWHSISDRADDPVLAPCSIPLDEWVDQLDTLVALGCSFVTADDLLAHLDHAAPLPPRAVLLNFDDAYVDFAIEALPVLRERGLPVVLFVVAGLIGRTNEWDQARGAATLPLLDADALREVRAAGVEIGLHSRTHRALPAVPPTEQRDELAGAVTTMAGLGLGRARLFAYPFGEHHPGARRTVSASGLAAAFAFGDRPVRAGAVDRWALPRYDIQRHDRGHALEARLFPGATTRLRRRAGTIKRVAASLR